ncbi:unnamed protein product [Dovyalis caffra]|uniref:Vinorine synthase-like n=1 Tax=Dovyalis caffra TaxID=77055 RepID=A0AAV1RNA9_9ROSI|nr:unnamed protein product [Dovyalis caffra]
MNVKILSKKLITPASPTPPHLRNNKVSWISKFQSPLLHLPNIFYYPSITDEDNIERSKQLQKSLSETLTIFYPFAGRYIDDNLILDCNDEGVEYVETQVSGCLSQLLEGGELETQLRNHLAPIPLQPENSPIVLVQFNMFECGGVAIGICIKHRTADAYTVFAFINAWATAARLGFDKVAPPSFQFPSIFSSRDIPTFIPKDNGDKKVEIQKRFVFNGAALSKLKAVASADINTSRQPTRVEVVTALLWNTLTVVGRAKHDRFRPSLLSLTFNLRGKIAMPIPDNYYGNLTSPALARFTPDDHDENKIEFHHFVDRVHNGIRKQVTDCAKISSEDDLFSKVINVKSEMIEAFNSSDADLYMFTSWCRMPIYEVDFGWGKPGWFSAVAVPGHNMFHLIDTEDGDGIEAWVSLEEDIMLLFQENSDIKAFTGQESLLIIKVHNRWKPKNLVSCLNRRMAARP